jgi:hypothetical protein
MRAIAGIALVFAMSAASGGCAVTGKLGFAGLQFVKEPAVVVEGLRGEQTEQKWIHEAKLATPPGCIVRGITVLTDSDATFTFACFEGGATVSGL